MSLIKTARGDFTQEASWGALKKSWRGYKIAKIHNDRSGMEKYAVQVRALQRELGKEQSQFPHLGLY